MSEKMRSYEAARTYFSVLGFLSWCVIILGGLVALGSLIAVGQMSRSFGGSSMAGLAGLIPGVAVMFAGFMGLVVVQIGRAGVDSAEYGQQSLKVAREQLEMSRQSLKRQQADSQSFAALKPSTEQQPTASFERKEPSVTSPPRNAEPGVHRGHKIIRVGGSYRALGDVFASHDEAVAAIDRKLGSPAIENKPEMPSSILLGPEPRTASEKQLIPVEQPSADGEVTAPRSYVEAERSVKLDGPNISTPESREVVEKGANGKVTEVTPVMSAEPDPFAMEEDPASKIKEEGGKYLFGRMEFSSREAAEKYVSQLGVNPNFQS